MTRPRIALVNPNATGATTAAMVRVAGADWPEADLVGVTNPAGPAFIATEDELETSARQVARLAGRLRDVDGVILAAFGDPGLAELGRALSVPVVGIGTASALAAHEAGRPFAVVTTTPGLVAAIDRLMTGPRGARYLGVFLTRGGSVRPSPDPAALRVAMADAMGAAGRAGAERIVIGGGPLAEAATRLDAPRGTRLVHPLRAACAMMRGSLGTGR